MELNYCSEELFKKITDLISGILEKYSGGYDTYEWVDDKVDSFIVKLKINDYDIRFFLNVLGPDDDDPEEDGDLGDMFLTWCGPECKGYSGYFDVIKEKLMECISDIESRGKSENEENSNHNQTNV